MVMQVLFGVLAFGVPVILVAAERPGEGEQYRLYDWPGEDGGYNIRMLSEGGYIIAGNTADSGGNRDFLLLKLGEDLEPDPAFGDCGRVRVGGTGEDQAADVLEILDAAGQADGFLVVGQSDRADGDFAGRRHWGKIDTVVLRLDRTGRLDPRFGESGSGIRFYGTTADDEPIVHRHNYSEPGERLVQTPDGFLVASHARAEDGDLTNIPVEGTHSGRDVFLFKINESGDFVEGWANRGRFRLGTNAGSQDRQQGSANDFIFSIQLHPDGSLFGGGYTLGRDITLNGRLVRTMGNNDGQGAENAFGDSRLYKMDGLMIRLTPDGRLDRKWGDEGVVFLGGTGQEKMYDVAIDPQGRYLVTGRTSSYDLQMERPADDGDGFDLMLLRLNPDGTLDTTFGNRGKVIFAGAEDDQALRVDTRSDGRIVLLGQSTSSSGLFSLPGESDLFRQAVVLVFADSGQLQRFYSLGLEGEDKPSSFVVDPSGRVVLTGFRLPAVDYLYKSDGPEIARRQLWVHAFQLR